jgi:hypothetical protein
MQRFAYTYTCISKQQDEHLKTMLKYCAWFP